MRLGSSKKLSAGMSENCPKRGRDDKERTPSARGEDAFLLECARVVAMHQGDLG